MKWISSHLSSSEIKLGLNSLTIEELRQFKYFLIGEIKYQKKKIRIVDKMIKERLEHDNKKD